MAKHYEIAKEFEREIVALLATDPRFYARVGYGVEPDMLPTEEARRIAEVVKAQVASTNGTPGGLSVVAQRLRRLREVGRITTEEANAAYDWLEAALDHVRGDLDVVVEETAIMLRAVNDRLIVSKSMELLGKRAPMTELIELIQKGERYGKTEERTGVRLDSSAFDKIRSLRRQNRMRTGIEDLDSRIKGGLARRQMGVALGGSGDGKSMFLCQVARTAVLEGIRVAVATLELNEGDWSARLIAGTVNVTIDSIVEGFGEKAAEDRLAYLRRTFPEVGDAEIQEFTSGTRVEEIWAWFDELNVAAAAAGERPFEMLVLDYADELGYPDRDGGGYLGMKTVFTGLRVGAMNRDIWVWTGTQSKGKAKQMGKLLELEDAADSMNKARVTDLFITLNVSGEEGARVVNIWVAKNRTGKAKMATGEMPIDFEFGRMTNPVDTYATLFQEMDGNARPPPVDTAPRQKFLFDEDE
jgi:hypothetical protein